MQWEERDRMPNSANRQGSGTQELSTPRRRRQYLRSWWITGPRNSGVRRREQERTCGWIWSGNIVWKGTGSTTKIQTWQKMFQQSSRIVSYSQGAWSNRINRNHGQHLTLSNYLHWQQNINRFIKEPKQPQLPIRIIKKEDIHFKRANWTTEFSWLKAYFGIYRNELADRLAKSAAWSSDNTIAFNRIPLSKLCREIEEEEDGGKWQKDWEDCKKAATTKQFFPNMTDRLKLRRNINPNLTALVIGHGKTRAYFHRLKVLDQATCALKKGDQTTDHLINQCTLLQMQRDHLKSNVLKRGDWPASHQELINTWNHF